MQRKSKITCTTSRHALSHSLKGIICSLTNELKPSVLLGPLLVVNIVLQPGSARRFDLFDVEHNPEKKLFDDKYNLKE